jgi:hypothetical protein
MSLVFATLTLIVLIGLVIWCVVQPIAGRALARVFSVLSLGTGAGVLVWGICAASIGETIRSPFGMDALIATPSEAIGWGAGFLVAGITALVLSCIGGCRTRTSKM